MKALVVTEDHRLEMRDIPRPTPGEYEALVRILACGVCSTTDREIVKGTQPFASDYPCVLGHESVGEVVAVGGKVASFRVGDWVTRAYAVMPGQTRDGLYSGWGGFAEYGLVRDGRAIEADGGPPVASDYTALRQNVVPECRNAAHAVLAISLAEVGSWFRHLGDVRGKTVVVAGAGIAGYAAVICAHLGGARKTIVLGRREARLRLACDLGADATVDVRDGDTALSICRAAEGRADVFCECAGSQALFEIGLDCLAQDGTLSVYGVPPGNRYTLPLDRLSGPRRIAGFPAEEHLAYGWALDLLARGGVDADKLLTHQWPLEQFARAFAQIDRGEVVKGMFLLRKEVSG